MSRGSPGALHEALARSPERVRQRVAERLPFPLDARGARAIRLTGAGSSAAHARFLAALLGEGGLPARFVPLDAFPLAGDPRDLLVVFSQALSPNARLALVGPERWREVVLVTAAASAVDPERREAVRALARSGVRLLDSLGADEFGSLLRVEGPLAGYEAAFRVAEALGASPPLEADRVADAMGRALENAAAAARVLAPHLLHDDLLLLASGAYRESVDNLRLKCVEGLLRPVPPVSDPLELAHGPFQALFARPATLLAFARADAPHERERLARVRQMLEPGRHRLVALEASLPGFQAIFEHEVWADALVLAAMTEAGGEPSAWPGRGRDGPIYGLAPEPAPLAEHTWPELEAAIAAGRRLALLPLGATEQHGPHLPLATDAWIADALAERFCARVPEAIRLPTLAVGASSEHLDFAGTLSLAPDTLVAVLVDLARSLSRHGFDAIFCFSAHGGNLGALRAAEPRLREAAAPARWIAVGDHSGLTARLHALASRAGVSAAEAGHHAGEMEASVIAALRPNALRRERLAPGRLDPPSDLDALFYPSLRPQAPSGTVGDPRRADPERANGYLDAWVEVLVDAYLGAKKRPNT